MIYSMTAFSRQQSHIEQGELVWEIRSVNHRYLEVHCRLPEQLRALEAKARDLVNVKLGRGKVECSLKFNPSAKNHSELKVNQSLVGNLMGAAEQVMTHLHSSPLPAAIDIMQWPGVLETPEQDLSPVQAAAAALLEESLDDLIAARAREGERLAELIQHRITALHVQIEAARLRMPDVIERVRERLAMRLKEFSEQLQQDRLEQEMALLAQRLDVDEEMDRLTTHLEEVTRVLTQDEPVGRRLDFLMQELNREANTLGSKSADTETTQISVEMKVLIEQMREQVQNIE